MSVSFNHFRFLPWLLAAASLPASHALAARVALGTPDKPAAKPAGDEWALATDEPEDDGRLAITVRPPRLDALKGSEFELFSADGKVRDFEISRNYDGTVKILVRILPADTRLALHIRPAGESAKTEKLTVAVPPMFFPRADSRDFSPGLDDTVSVPLRFTQRLDPAQTPPRLATTPAIEGLRCHIDGHELVLTGKFPTRKTVRVRFDSDVLAADGFVFKAGETVPVTIGARPGTAAFAFDSGVLSPHGSLGVPVRLCNLPKLTVRIARLDPVNLVPALHDSEMRSTLLEESAKAELTLKSPQDAVREVLFDVREKNAPKGASPLGMRLLRLDWEKVPGEWNTSDESFVCVTDIALTSHLDADGRRMTVWATGLTSGIPLSGVSVEVRSAQNRVLAKGLTDPSGLVKLELPGKPGERPAWVVTGTLGEDFSYCRTAGAEVAENKDDLPARPAGMQVMLYGDRGVWRGGETVRLTGLVRTATGGAAPESPLELTVKRPDGRVLTRSFVTPDKAREGFFHADIAISPEAPYGAYEATVSLPGDKTPLARLPLRVAAFEPLRLRTGLVAQDTKPLAQPDGGMLPLHAGEPPRFSLESRYRFGAPASGLASSATVRIEPAAFAFPAFPGYTFGRSAESEGRLLKTPRALLDASGARLLAPAVAGAPGAWMVKCSAAVTEPGGRSDTAVARALWVNAAALPGLALDGPPPAAGETFPVKVALADASGRPLADGREVVVTAERVIENWTLQREGERMIWRRTEELVPAGEWRVSPGDFRDGLAKVVLSLAAPGAHRLHAGLPDGARTDLPVFVGGPAGAFADAAPHRIDLHPTRERAAPGDTLPVRVNAPFTGTALLTVETDRVVSSATVSLRERSCELPVTVPADARGSVWVRLRAVRPLEANQPAWKPVEASGLAMITVDHTAAKLDCRIEAPAKALPGESAELVVRVPHADRKPVAVHCWAVDTGVLDITDFRTPDALDTFLGAKADGVRTAGTFDELLPDFARTLERIGAGDGFAAYRGAGLSHRKPVAIVWSESAMTGADGTLRRKITLPEHTGELRWMAVAARGDTYGGAKAHTVLARPVQLETSAPAFAAPGDTLDVPVALFNSTGAPQSVALEASVSNLEIVQPTPSRVELTGDGKPWRGSLRVRAKRAAGPAEITLRATGAFPGGAVTERLPLTLRLAAAAETRTAYFALKPGEKRILGADIAGIVPEGARMSVRAGHATLAPLAHRFAALVDYPHGCLEQTSSRVIALAAASDAFGLPGTADAPAARARALALLRQGVDRLALLRRADGGLGYWQNSAESDVTGSCLAAEALAAAGTLGVKADAAFTGELTGYLRHELYRKDCPPPRQARLCAALAALGSGEANRMRFLKENAADLDNDALASLALAFVRSGDTPAARDLLDARVAQLSPSAEPERSDNRYDCSVERDARMLDALAAARPDSPATGAFAAALAGVASRCELNTFEEGAVLAALARHAKLAPDAGADSSLELALGDAGSAVRTGAGLAWSNLPADRTRTLENKGAAPVSVCVSVTGAPRDTAAVGAQRGLTLSRELLDADSGEPIPAGIPLKVGRSVKIRVRLGLAGENESTVSDVAMTDLFPACFEPDGGKVTVLREDKPCPGWDCPVQRSELREDRALAFLTVQNGLSLEYLVRVTAAGRFTLPAPQAESMYRPDVRASGTPTEVVCEN